MSASHLLLLSNISSLTLYLKAIVTTSIIMHFFDNLLDADVWSHLDSIITHPTGSRLQKVDINIEYSFRYDDDVVEPYEDEVMEPVLDALPLLREKGILFVEATRSS
jgi:hypothetical protein